METDHVPASVASTQFDLRTPTASEDERVWESYAIRNKIDWRDRRCAEEWARLRADALANRHLYPIPITEGAYRYHGTARVRLPRIVVDGLIPSERSRWSRDPFVGNWSLGKVFFSDTVEKAAYYAKQASSVNPIILRVLSSALLDPEPDHLETVGSCYVEFTVPPTQIEVWAGRKWKQISMSHVPSSTSHGMR